MSEGGHQNKPGQQPQAETPGAAREQALPGGSVQGDRSWAQQRIAGFFRGQRVLRSAKPGAEHAPAEVSHPGEPAEVEADKVADGVADKLHGGGDKAGAADAAGGGPKEAPAPISAKLDGVGRKAYLKKGPAPAPTPGGKPKKAEDPSGPNPNFEADARTFEGKLGPVAYGKGAGVGPALISKVRAYIEQKCKTPLTGPMDQLKAELQKLTSAPGFAGGVATPEDVKQLLSTQAELDTARAQAGHLGAQIKDGNLREQMTIVANFGNVMNKDLLAATPADLAKVMDWVQKAGLSKTEVDQRVARMQKAGGASAPWPEQPAGQVPSGGTDKQKGAQGALSEQSNARLAKNPQTDPTGKVNPRRPDRSKEGKPDDPTRTDLTVGQMQQQGMPLSDREMRAQGATGMGDRLKWSEGVKTWMVDKEHKWVQAQQQLGIPLGAGPSGTTNMIMNTAQMLGGVDTTGIRMACIGYLLPIHAHTLVEILTAAQAHGVPFTPGQKMYRNIDPLKEDELRTSCGRTGGKDGKNLFPDEKTPSTPST